MALLKTNQKKFAWGGRSLFTSYPAHGAVSIVGSVAGGEMRMASEEIASIHAEMLMDGTKSHSKKEIQQMLDAMGANLSFFSTPSRLSFSARVRVAHVDQLLSLIAELLSEPMFPEGELALLKKREEASLALEAQDTRAQAGIYLARMLYQKGHPNYSDTTTESRAKLAKITSKELRKLHAKLISRNELIVSMAGDLTAARAHSLVGKHFSSLPNTKVSRIAFKKAPAPKAKVHAQRIEHKAGVDYMLGLTTGITAEHRDYPALLLGVQVLGNWGGFTGRLMRTVREIEGLTYAIYALMSGFTSKVDGHISIWANFPPQNFEKGKAALMREAKLIVEEGVSDEEARKHREMYVARIKVGLSNSGAFARVAHNLAVENRPMTYLDEFNKKISSLTAAKVNKALKKYLILNKLSESSAGPVGTK